MSMLPPKPPTNVTTNDLDELEAELERDPKGTLEVMGTTIRRHVDEEQVHMSVARLKAALIHPEAARALRNTARSERAAGTGAWTPPPGATIYPDIPIDPSRHEFETVGDLDGWVANCAKWWLQQKRGTLQTAPRPTHSPGRPFRYVMQDRAGLPIRGDDTVRIALFSDFATGEGPSRHIARHIANAAPHYAIHLGDVYYAGIQPEVRDHLAAPLAQILPKSRTFAMNGNHEMLCGGQPYFDYIAAKHEADPAGQEQESSYFSLFGDHYAVIAIDTAYDWKHDGELLQQQDQLWLEGELRAARESNPRRTTILLSQHEPLRLGKRSGTALLQQVKDVATRAGATIDYWFWGDEHYCARWDRAASGTRGLAFDGYCIGNAGYPVERLVLDPADLREHLVPVAARAAWIDRAPRFPTVGGARNPRSDLFTAGFCLLELGPDQCTFRFLNWLNLDVKVEVHPR